MSRTIAEREIPMSTIQQLAAETHVRDIWFDGNEEIVEIGAVCPVDDCRSPIVTAFTRPGITSKSYQCRRCGARLIVVRPAFGFETAVERRLDD